jgi:hypothetical protein
VGFWNARNPNFERPGAGMIIGARVIVAGSPGWPDHPGTIEEAAGVDYLVRLDEKHVDGTPFTGWPWCRARMCARCGKVHFLEQMIPDAMDRNLERAIVAKLARGESVADMWPPKC